MADRKPEGKSSHQLLSRLGAERFARFFDMGVSLKDHPLSAAIIQAYYSSEGWLGIFSDQSAQWISKDADGGIDYLSRVLGHFIKIPLSPPLEKGD